MKTKGNIAIGLMSGTSLDGLDIIAVVFDSHNSKISYDIKKTETIPYSELWQTKLRNAHNLPVYDFLKLHSEFGSFMGKQVNTFLAQNAFSPSDIAFIASHGQTIFHNPQEGITTQIGDGVKIYAQTGIPVINNFRSLDVALGGQGAPLVPVGDELLFPEYNFCLNLGGFANISYGENKQRVAYDIVPVNFVLNRLASKLNLPYDMFGQNASKGYINKNILSQLNNLPFYQQPHPKSLGREWVESNIFPVFSNSNSVHDLLRTYVEHICIQITQTIDKHSQGTILATGGGAYNTFLIERLQQLSNHKIIIPDANLIEFKESLIFALLGWLKINGIKNTYSSCTGALRNTVSGNIIKE